MKTRQALDRRKGFALVITLALLALLVLSIYALSGLTRVGGQVATTGVYQVQARQHALLGLNSALSQLKQFAGPDNSLTGTADILSSSKDINSRWTGVWLSGDSNPRWLVSGGVNPATYSPTVSIDASQKVVTADSNDIVLVNSGSINTLASRYAAGDGVVAPRVPIPAYDRAGTQYTTGDYAYWVGDEGVKLSAALPGIGAPPAPAPSVHSVSGLPNSWTPSPTNVLKAISYEQLVTNAGAGATTIKNTFHCLTLVHVRYTDYPSRRAGMINVNTASSRLWRGVFATYALSHPGGSSTAFATAMSNRPNIWAPAGSDKIANGPFQTVAGFLVSSPSVTDAIVVSGGASLPFFQDTMQPLFTVRSDTFRIRAYGDALNPVADPGQPAGKVEATAYCEAIVQRVKDSETGDGRFVITYFRWLGPDDI